jgi:vanillate O-demethylase monooxygenase subunit
VHALEDHCPHRGAPLSLGRVVERRLVCGSHGLEMGCDGNTVAMPGQRVRGFAPIRSFPVLEPRGLVWVWPGDTAQADESAFPALPWADDPAWAYGGGRYHIACDYRLMVDNLMDLTQETYVHADSIGQKEIDEVLCTTHVDGDEVVTQRLMHGVKAPPFWQMALRMNDLPTDQPVDRWQVCCFSPPSHVIIEVGVALAGRGGPDAPDDCKAAAVVVDFITPETDTNIWYFWGMARLFKPRDASLKAQIREGQGPGPHLQRRPGHAGAAADQPQPLARAQAAQPEHRRRGHSRAARAGAPHRCRTSRRNDSQRHQNRSP